MEARIKFRGEVEICRDFVCVKKVLKFYLKLSNERLKDVWYAL